MKAKVGLLVEKLNGGGAERSLGLLSIILSKLNYNVVVIVLHDDVVYPYDGRLINLGKYKNGSRTFFSKLDRYIQLKKTIKTEGFDLILDYRLKEFALRELLLVKLVFNQRIMVNMVRSFNLVWYFTQYKFLAKYLYKNYLGINAVAFKIQNAIEKKYNFKHVTTIHNPIDAKNISAMSSQELDINDNYVIAVGRLSEVKQFDKLIETYGKSNLFEKGIVLNILGDGPEKEVLESKIEELKLKDYVRLIPFEKNPYPYMKRAKFLILSSKYEGFPRVLIESLACGIPVISFNCDSGPSEIITNRKNGLLVDNQDFNGLLRAMNNMVEDEHLYQRCVENAKPSVEAFSMREIGSKWDKYIKEVLLK